MNVNQVVLSGNLTRDPVLRHTNSGNDILDIGIAVDDRVQNRKTGEWEDRANFFDCTLFGRQATSLANILHKGMKVAINGRLHYDTWKDNQGNNRSRVTINVNNIDFLQRRQDSLEQKQAQSESASQTPDQPAPASKTAEPKSEAPATEFTEYDSDIPF